MFSNGGAKKKSKAKTVKMGRVASPVDVRSKSDVAGFETLLEKGPLTLVLVYADWCGACHRFKENKWNNVLKMPNRTMNISSVREDMLPETSLANAKVPHYPTLLLVGKDKKPAEFTMPNGEITNALPPAAKENVSQIVQTPVPELPEPEAVNALVNEVSSAPPEPTGAATVAPSSGNAMPPAMSNDLQQSIQNATTVANKPTKNIIGGARVGGGLFTALQKIASKSTAAFKLKRRTRKGKKMTRKQRKTLRKRNKLGRFSRRR